LVTSGDKAMKKKNWFSIGVCNGEYFIEVSENGREVKEKISRRGAIKSKEHYLALGYKWK